MVGAWRRRPPGGTSRYGLDGAMVVRSAFTALPLDRLDEPLTDGLDALFSARRELTRYRVDPGLDLPT